MGKKRENYKSVNFDLDTNIIKNKIATGAVSFSKYTAAYGRIKRFLGKNGFEHDQGSGYISREPMSAFDVQKVFKNLGKNNVWLADCFTACRLTSFDKGKAVITDLIPDVKTGAAQASASGISSSPTGYKPGKDGAKARQAAELAAVLRGETVPKDITANTPGAVPSVTAQKALPGATPVNAAAVQQGGLTIGQICAQKQQTAKPRTPGRDGYGK